jgi:hypothetical protein
MVFHVNACMVLHVNACIVFYVNACIMFHVNACMGCVKPTGFTSPAANSSVHCSCRTHSHASTVSLLSSSPYRFSFIPFALRHTRQTPQAFTSLPLKASRSKHNPSALVAPC